MFKKIYLFFIFQIISISFFFIFFSSTKAQTTVNVKDYGALGNGTADDTGAIHAAFNALPAGGGVVYFPPGRYKVGSRALPLTKSNVTFKGAGMYQSVLVATGRTVESTANVSNVAIEDLGFDTTSGGSTQIDINGSGAPRPFRISRCRFWNTRDMNIIVLTNAQDVVIEDSLFHSPGVVMGRAVLVNFDANNLVFRRNKFLWLHEGIIFNSEQDRVYNARNITIEDNWFDGYWWLVKAGPHTGQGNSVTYTSNSLTDTNARFGNFPEQERRSTDVVVNIRVMPVREQGSATYTKNTLTDPTAKFVSSGILKGEIIKTSDGAFGVVLKVDSETKITVEEWLNDSDRLPRSAPPDGTPYTAYGVYLGALWGGGNFTSTRINVHDWWDLTGKRVTPPNGTRYEVLTRRTNYTAVHAEPGMHDSLIKGNVALRGWSDQLSFFGGPNVKVIGNYIADGEDMGVTLNGYNNLVEGNTIIHQGACAIWFNGNGNEARNNVMYDNQWVNPSSNGLGGICTDSASNMKIINNHSYYTGYGLARNGFVIRAHNSLVSNNSGHNHPYADIYLRNAVGITLCKNTGKIIETGTSGTVTTDNCSSLPIPTPIPFPGFEPGIQPPIGSPSATPSGKPGDANGDGRVDGLDYVIWVDNYGTNSGASVSLGDFNNDHRVDGLDYVIWVDNYGG